MSLDVDVRRLVAEGSGLPGQRVIPGNDPAPAPFDTYATVLRVQTVSLGYPGYVERDAGRGVDTFETRRRTYSVQWFREGCQDLAERFALWVRTYEGLGFAEAHRFVVAVPPTVSRLDVPVGDRFEQRMRCDLEIDFVAATPSSPDWVDRFEGRTVYYGAGIVIDEEV